MNGNTIRNDLSRCPTGRSGYMEQAGANVCNLDANCR